MYYSIYGLWPKQCMGGYGFGIRLYPPWKEMVARSDITQEQVNHVIESSGRSWLDICGYDQLYDPDERWLPGMADDRYARPSKPGPRARPLYQPSEALHVSWGPWGPEHINVPGDACGLDIDRDWGHYGAQLVPHNVDNWSQVQLLLMIFTWFADHLSLTESLRKEGHD